jgi:hypothetical protein
VKALGIVLVVLVALALIAILCVLVQAVVKSLRERRRRQRDRDVQWTHYCTPKDTEFQIGVERVTEDGRVLSNVEMYRIPFDADLDRHVAIQEARMRAGQYNDERVGM